MQEHPIPDGFDGTILDKYSTLKQFNKNVGRTSLMEVETPAGDARIFAKC